MAVERYEFPQKRIFRPLWKRHAVHDMRTSRGASQTWFGTSEWRRRRGAIAATQPAGVHARSSGMRVTSPMDRDYFNAIYFRQPQGILFEIAPTSPGFAVDEDAERLGEELRLPSQHERLRPQLERLLTPLTNPRTAQRAQVQA